MTPQVAMALLDALHMGFTMYREAQMQQRDVTMAELAQVQTALGQAIDAHMQAMQDKINAAGLPVSNG